MFSSYFRKFFLNFLVSDKKRRFLSSNNLLDEYLIALQYIPACIYSALAPLCFWNPNLKQMSFLLSCYTPLAFIYSTKYSTINTTSQITRLPDFASFFQSVLHHGTAIYVEDRLRVFLSLQCCYNYL